MMVRITTKVCGVDIVIYCRVSDIDSMAEYLAEGEPTTYALTVKGKAYSVTLKEFDRVQSLVFQEEEG